MSVWTGNNNLMEEDTNVEYKRLLDSDSIKKTIVAFSNDWQDEGGGTILVGIDNDGSVVGLEGSRDDLLKRASNFASDGSIDPTPLVSISMKIESRDKSASFACDGARGDLIN